jgi:GGDEF domain-containing protein
VIAPGVHGENVHGFAEAIREAISAYRPGSQAPAPRASLGAAVFPEDGDAYETLMRVADQRLLRLKSDDGHLSSRARGNETLRLL